jgi:hypothetical protein
MLEEPHVFRARHLQSDAFRADVVCIRTLYAVPGIRKVVDSLHRRSFEWRDILQSLSLRVYATGLRRHANVLKDLARERAEADKRKCLLCANIDEK